MPRLRTAFIACLLIAVSCPQGAWGQAGSIGTGWCPVCGKDVNLATHDFTHGASSGNGNRKRISPPPPKLNPDNYAIISLYNRTSRSISYSIRSTSGGSWYSSTLSPGGSVANWHNADAKIQIYFLVNGVAKRYDLQGNFYYIPGRKPNVEEGVPYHFGEAGGAFDLFTGPGTPPQRPSYADVQRANEEEERRLQMQRRQSAAAEEAVKRARAQEAHRLALIAWNKRDWNMAILHFKDELSWNPGALDASVYIAEARKNIQREEEERRTREIAEAEKRTKQKIAEVVAGGLNFDSPSGSTTPGSKSGTTGLDFPDADSGTTRFSKGSQGSAPVVVPAQASRPTKAVDPATKSLSVQADIGRYGLVNVPAAILSARDSGLLNPLDAEQAKADRKLLEPVDIAKFTAMGETEREAELSKRLSAAYREILRNSAGELRRALKGLEEINVLQPGRPLLEQLKDPRVAAFVEVASREVCERELRREQDAVAEIRNIRIMCVLKQEAAKKQLATALEPVMRSWDEISKRFGAQESSEIMLLRDQWRWERDGYLDQLREQGYIGEERTLEEVERRAKRDPAVRLRIKVLQDLAAKRTQDEEKIRAKYTRLIVEEHERVLREKFPVKP